MYTNVGFSTCRCVAIPTRTALEKLGFIGRGDRGFTLMRIKHEIRTIRLWKNVSLMIPRAMIVQPKRNSPRNEQ